MGRKVAQGLTCLKGIKTSTSCGFSEASAKLTSTRMQCCQIHGYNARANKTFVTLKSDLYLITYMHCVSLPTASDTVCKHSTCITKVITKREKVRRTKGKQ